MLRRLHFSQPASLPFKISLQTIYTCNKWLLNFSRTESLRGALAIWLHISPDAKLHLTARLLYVAASQAEDACSDALQQTKHAAQCLNVRTSLEQVFAPFFHIITSPLMALLSRQLLDCLVTVVLVLRGSNSCKQTTSVNRPALHAKCTDAIHRHDCIQMVSFIQAKHAMSRMQAMLAL